MNDFPSPESSAPAAPAAGNAPDFSSRPHASATFGSMQQAAEGFGKLPHSAESFRNVPHASERTERHTLTVREVVRLFEDRGVPRSERTIVNWCQPTRLGAAHLDAYFDNNERRYYVTPESAERVIEEEKAKQVKKDAAPAAPTEVPEPAKAEPKENNAHTSQSNDGTLAKEFAELKSQYRDLEITNRAKDLVIDSLEKRHQQVLGRLIEKSQRVGELESRVLVLESAEAQPSRKLPVRSISGGDEQAESETTHAE